MKEIHLVYETVYGDDWQTEYTHVVHSLNEVEHYQSEEYEQEQLSVNGIEAISISVDLNVDEKKLRHQLTVYEYCNVFPEVKKMLDEYFQPKIEVGKEYRVKNEPKEFGPQFRWLIGHTVKVVGEKMGNKKYPIIYDSSLIPTDGIGRPATSIRGDLLEEL